METEPKNVINAAIETLETLRTNIINGDITKGNLDKVLERKAMMQQLLHSANVDLDLNLYQQKMDAFESHVNAVNTLLLNMDSTIEGYL